MLVATCQSIRPDVAEPQLITHHFFFSAGRQQRRTHSRGRLGGVQLSPPTQRHHQPQGYRFHRCVTLHRHTCHVLAHNCAQAPVLRSSVLAVFYAELIENAFSLIASIFTAAAVSVIKARLHPHIHSSAVISLANGVLLFHCGFQSSTHLRLSTYDGINCNT